MKTFRRVLFIVVGLLWISSSQAQLIKESLKYSQFLQYLNRFYVDSVNADKMVEDAIRYQLEKLDPHSTYISAADVQKMNEPLQGNFEGIGISFNILNDTLFVISPITGGPSERVGIRSGDRILKVDGKSIAGIGITNEDVFAMLRGAKGTQVIVSIKRRYVDELLDFSIVRDKIPINSLDAAYVVEDGIGYIKLSRFAMTSMDEFEQSALKLKQAGVKDLILDLTGNAGGYLDIAVALSDQFLDDEKAIVYTEGIHSERRDYYAQREGLFERGNLVILIDEGSASASEIVSGAIQDWDRGIIIGRRSFGKGLVQRQLDLPDGSLIRLTTAKYYTPTGRLIQKPYGDGLENYENEIFTRYKHGEFQHSDSISFPDSLQYRTLVNQRIVFGGGGIMPDIFVPIDTTEYTDYYRDLIRKGILNQFVLQYVDKNRRKLQSSYKAFDTFKSAFSVTGEILNKMVDYAETEGLPRNDEELKISADRISVTLKSYIARDLFSTSEFYEVINQNDKNFEMAVEVLKNWEEYSDKLLHE
jgi:carboxyl-terminal processing protease